MNTEKFKSKNGKLPILVVISRFLFGVKHEFDMETPYIDEIESQHKHSLSGKTQISKWTAYGWKCKNCDKVLWLDKEMMDCLPKSMKYGCGDKNGL